MYSNVINKLLHKKNYLNMEGFLSGVLHSATLGVEPTPSFS